VSGVESLRAGIAGPATGPPGFARVAPPGVGLNGVSAGATLADRLTALARMTQIGFARTGHDGFSPGLLREAEELLGRAGERLRMSAEHTVVVLAGGTGSGKSSLFNRLAGADFSPVGVVRPMTKEAYACVWGVEGARPLLDWLGVRDRNRYARSSALDDGERPLNGLLLLDLPDHDSVLSRQSGSVNRLVGLADLMVWVLDPQKYADAAVHSRYLVPMAGHSSVIAVVLNQADLLTPEQASDCVEDLRRLLDSEGLHNTQVMVTSAVDGTGLGDLRDVLVRTVSARRASTERIAADVDALAARFVPYAGVREVLGATGPPWANGDAGSGEGPGDGTAADDGTAAQDGDGSTGAERGESRQDAGADGARPARLPASSVSALEAAFSQAAGVPGVARVLQSARELKAVDYVGWPVSWLADRVLRRDPVRKIRLGNLWSELRGVAAGPAGAHRAEIDNAITGLADDAGAGLPAPWPATVRAAARSQVADIPEGLGAAIARALPEENSALPWWRLVAAWQGFLLGAAAAGLAWIGVLLAVGVFHASRHTAVMLSDAMLLPWVALMVAAVLLLGWLTGTGCMTLVLRAAEREREQAEQNMRAGAAGVAQQMVVTPVEQELATYAGFCAELAVARDVI
jgi:GTP-binding protein EngB required for normal cell division